MVWGLLAGGLLLIVLAFSLRLFLLGRSSASPVRLVMKKDGLAPCPRSPSCVSSQSKDPTSRVEPIAATGPMEEALSAAYKAITSMPGGRVVGIDGPHLRAEFTSRLFRFVDDLELLWDPSGVFEVRSASRVGRSDLGANRRRVESLRRTLEKLR